MKSIVMVVGVMGYWVLLIMLIIRAEATCNNLRFIIYGIVVLIYVAIIVIGIRGKRRRDNAKIK